MLSGGWKKKWKEEKGGRGKKGWGGWVGFDGKRKRKSKRDKEKGKRRGEGGRILNKQVTGEEGGGKRSLSFSARVN